MADAIIDAPAGDNASKQKPPALTAREERTLYRAMGILETCLRNPASAALNTPNAVRDYLTLKLAREEAEQFMVLFLDAQHRLIEAEIMFSGTLTQTSVYPREVVKRALYHNAGAVILAHNHPSGVAEPSASDRMLTDALKQSLALVDVRVLDHFIVAGRNAYSFEEGAMFSRYEEQSQPREAEKRKVRKPRAKVKAASARPPAYGSAMAAHV